MSSGTSPPGAPRQTCRFYASAQGCRFGAKCKFKHEVTSSTSTPLAAPSLVRMSVVGQVRSEDSTPQRPMQKKARQRNRKKAAVSQAPITSQPPDVDTRPGTGEAGKSADPATPARPKRGPKPCFAWKKAGTCPNGDQCLYVHDPEIRAALLRNAAAEAQRRAQEEQEKREEEGRQIREEQQRAEEAREEAERIRALEEEERRTEEARRLELERLRALEEERRAEEAQREAERRRIQEEVRRERQRQEQERQEREEEERKQREAQKVEQFRRRRVEQAKADATVTAQQVVMGSIVTFGAGLDIHGVIAGFECCTITIKSLPGDAREHEVRALFTQQGIESGRFQLVGLKRVSGRKQDATVIIDSESGLALTAGLDQLEFREENLSFEISTYKHEGGMSAKQGQDLNTLAVSWRAPSQTFIVEYPSYETAEEKRRRLDGTLLEGRRLQVMMNTPPPGKILRHFNRNSIKIQNVPLTVDQTDICRIADSSTVKPLRAANYQEQAGCAQLRADMERCVPNAMESFDHSPAGSDGYVHVRAKFSSWEQADRARELFNDQRKYYLGNAPIRCRLPKKMEFTVVVSSAQYIAQKSLFDELDGTISDRKACNLIINSKPDVAIIRVAGNVEQAVGSLKLRVQRIIAGEVVNGWHRSMGSRYVDGAFAQRVMGQTGVFLRTDWKKQTLRIFGDSSSVQAARELIDAELQRLASTDWSVKLKRQSIGYMVRHALPALKDMVGEDNVTLNIADGLLTITGDEEARHAVDRFISDSLNEVNQTHFSSDSTECCPICYCDVTSPLELGCGHVYCESCLRHFVISAADSDKFPLICLGDEAKCEAPIPIPVLHRFLPPKGFQRLLEVVFNHHITDNPLLFKFCSTPDCGQIYRSATSELPTTVDCPNCFSSVCNGCHEETHSGMSCAEAKAHRDPNEQDRLLDQWFAQQGGRVKRCPRCNIMIEKNEGCNHMSCRCGAHICWRCMGVFAADTIYNHMRDAHGGFYEDPIAPDIDYVEQQRLLREAEERQVRARAAAAPGRLVAGGTAVPQAPAEYAFDAEDWWAWQARARELRQHQDEVDAQERRRRTEAIRLQWQADENRRQEQLRLDIERNRRAQVAREAERNQNRGWGCVVM